MSVDRDVVAGLLAQLDPAQVAALPDAVLAALTDWADPACAAVALAEADRRDRARAWVPRTGGAAARLRRVDVAEDDFAAYLENAYLRAEAECCGHLLTPAGWAAGVDPRDLFRGPAVHAYRWASEELREWWAANGRLTVTAFRAGLAGERAAYADLDAVGVAS